MARELNIRKKFSALMLAVSGCLVFSSGTLAAPFDQDYAQVTSEVAKYAVVKVDGSMYIGNFTGLANEEQPPGGVGADDTKFEVETNTALSITFDGGDLTHLTDLSSTIETAYSAREVWRIVNGSKTYTGTTLGFFNRSHDTASPGTLYSHIGPLTKVNWQPAQSTFRYEMLGWGRLGSNVSSQKAGDYKTTITLTVSAP